MIDINQTKECKTCGKTKRLSEFRLCRTKDGRGLTDVCNDCINAKRRESMGGRKASKSQQGTRRSSKRNGVVASCKNCIGYPCFARQDTTMKDVNFAAEGCIHYKTANHSST